MKYLLDTHILVWALSDDPMLSKKARKILEDPESECCFSPVSITEISIKHSKHPELMPLTGEDARTAFIASDFRELPYVSKHAILLDALPRKHGDPFDRMLLAQAMAEDIPLLTHDDPVVSYGRPVMRV